jgi:hypothetical protein
MNTDEASRDELAERVEQLEAQVEQLESLVQIKSSSNDRFALEDIWVGNIPLGTIIKNNSNSVESVQDDLSELANGGVSQPGHENRESLLPLHSMWIDTRDGADDRISNASVRRAAILFRELLRQAADGSRAAVGVTRERFILKAPDAKQPILEHDDSIDTISSQQVRRAFEQAQLLSGRECDCDDLEGCEHGMLVARFSSSTNKLTVDRELLIDYLRRLDGDATATDDPVDPGEDAADDTDDIATEAADELDRISSAQSNAGVSSSDATALDHGDAPDGGTQPR